MTHTDRYAQDRVQMKIASALLIGLLTAGAAHAHGDRHATMQGNEDASGHAAALGEPGNPDKVTRTVDITMSDAMRFTPSSIRVLKGETIRFHVSNEGHLKHEFVLGTLSELEEHAKLMVKFPEMQHDNPNAVSVEPGQTGELIWHFSKAGQFDFACLIPGHFEAGMKGRIVVRR